MKSRFYRFTHGKVLLVCTLLSLLGILFGTSTLTACRANGSSQGYHPATVMLPAYQRFIAFGDNGSGSTDQMRLAKQMYIEYQKQPFGLALMLGDNIYPFGNVDKLGKSRFTIPYSSLLNKRVRFMPVLGNHDTLFWGIHTKQEIAFFNMPGLYYDFVSGNIHFYAIDTMHFDEAQRNWLRARLAQSKEKWKIVYGHYPVFSSGEHGSTKFLIQNLEPLLEIYHVDLYLCGHDHDYERFAPKAGVTYIVSGGGGAHLRKFKKIVPGSLIRKSIHHFLLFTLKNSNELDFKAIDENGQTIDSSKLTKQVPQYSKHAA